MATPRSATPATVASAPHEAEAESSTPAVDPATVFARDMAGYVFNAGFCHQQWADVQVSFFGTSLRLHRLILARSPYLARLLANSMPGGSVQLLFTDENISEEAVYVAIQHLYNPSLDLVSASNARAVLAAACLLGNMGDLEERAYSTISGSLLSADIGDLVAWLAPSPRIHANGNGTPSGANGNGNGFAFGSVPAAPVPSQPTGAWATAPLAYGEWSRRLRADVEDYLVRALPASITAEGQALHTDPRLLAAYVPLPYELFKACTEAPALPISFIQDRFAFAKRVIAQRKKIAQAQAAAAAAAGIPAAQFEEGVVLALKPEENGMAVHITRKPKRSRGALWKVEG